ncbi:hypothetical protein RRG08_038889 [Elysia crispata]|uniref:Uncharacterized protein n=1 Tax=Elysia crispata TaxID=231223 RepID=A0AAE0Y6X2_9GAST|nr:hypothetical protein RRG08_038889 [Elysia crispata]
MSTILCPAPGCEIEGPTITPMEVLTSLIDINSTMAHAAITPAPTPVAAGKAEKDRGEPVRTFAARLKVCNSENNCTSSVDYSDGMVRDALIRGLEDEGIRLSILGEPKQNMSLEKALWYDEEKERGKRSASCLLEGNLQTVAAAASSCKRHEKNSSSD